ncbi:MAG: hypothetical protein WCD70_09220 [Alphaproteobacteria bacterium]
MEWEQIEAKVVEGQRLASGTSQRDPSFNEEIVKDGVKGKGTLFLQAGEFKKHGLDLDAYFGEAGYVNGTLNLLIEPQTWTLGKRDDFEYFLSGVHWTDKLDKPGEQPFVENFFLSPCQIIFGGNKYKAMIYIPDPATKPKHHAPLAPYIDVIAPRIPGIGYGSLVTLFYNSKAIHVKANDL